MSKEFGFRVHHGRARAVLAPHAARRTRTAPQLPMVGEGVRAEARRIQPPPTQRQIVPIQCIIPGLAGDNTARVALAWLCRDQSHADECTSRERRSPQCRAQRRHPTALVAIRCRRGVGALHQLPPAAKGIYVVHPLRGFGTADGHAIATGEHMAELSCSSSQHRSRKRIAHNQMTSFAHRRPPITAAAAHPSPPTPRRASAAPPSPAGTECWRLHERRRRRQRLCGVNALLNDIHGQDTLLHAKSAPQVL